MKLWRKTVDLFGQRWGIEKSTLYVADSEEKYMDRYILYVAGFTARLHHFFHGDDDRAPHDHPWVFYTLPFTTYIEELREYPGWALCPVVRRRYVKRFRFHRREAEFKHIVVGRPRWDDKRPFWTFVVTGRRKRMWGFWPDENTFIDYRKWK